MGSRTRWAAVAAHGSRVLQSLSGLGNELLSVGRSSPGILLREVCYEARLHMVPERLLVMLARSEALQKRAPKPCPRGALGVPSYAMEGGAPGAGADPDEAPLA